MEMPQPSLEHKRLHRLVGRWVGEEQLHPSPWDPQGGPATGRVDNRLELDGFAVVQHYEQERGGVVTFRGHGVFSWDARESRYLMHWWDSMGSPVNVFVGDFEGDVLTMSYHSTQGHHRVVTDLSQNDQYDFLMQLSEDGEQWTTFMEGRYAREA